ncbi:MAG: sporulation protein YqfD [Bacillota bacterium]
MQIKDWQALWQGYVIITITGKAPERFINLAMVNGIFLWDISTIDQETLQAKVAIDQFKRLRGVARLSGNKFKILKKKGLPFALRRMGKRKGFFLGLAFFVIILYFFSAFIWFVDCTSIEKTTAIETQAVLKLAADLGLKPGVLKYGLDIKEVERLMEIKMPQLAWVGIEIEGTRANIRLVEKKIPDKEQSPTGPGNLIAIKDGVIDEILVIEGEGLVKPGDTVKKGQILISGLMSIEAETEGEQLGEAKIRLVKSQGIVKARVWYEGVGEIPLIEAGEKETGKKAWSIRLVVKDREMNIKGSADPPFSYYKEKITSYKPPKWRNWELPVEIIKISYLQVKPYTTEIEPSRAQALGLKQARESLINQIDPSSKIVASWETVEESPPGTVKVKVIVEAIENIAGFQSTVAD